MSASPECREIRELAPELALGIVSGEERARALEHVAGCPQCRELLRGLSDVADGLLSLVPSHEPPVGFESRVNERLFRHPRASRWRVAVAAAAAAAVVAGIAAGAVLWTTSRDRELGRAYAETLAVADGEYFSAAALTTGTDRKVGHVFGYEGAPSWLFVTVSTGRDGRYRIVLEEGRQTHTLGWIELEGGRGTWGGTLPHDLHEADGLVLRSHGRWLSASL
jgi:hypothetical protein